MESEKLNFKIDSNNNQLASLFLGLHDQEVHFSKKGRDRFIYIVDFSAGLENTINELATLLPEAATENTSLVVILLFFTTINKEKVDYFKKLIDQQPELVQSQTTLIITKDIYSNFTYSSGLAFDRYIRQTVDNNSIHISRSGATVYHPLYIQDFLVGLKKAILSRSKSNPVYLLSNPVSELELTYKLNTLFAGSIDIYNSLEETYQNNINSLVNTSQLLYNWFPDTEIDQILKTLDKQIIDVASDHKLVEGGSKYHFYQTLTSKIPKVKFFKIKKPNWVRYFLIPLVILLASYLVEIGLYLYLVQSATARVDTLFSQPFESITVDNQKEISKSQFLLEITHFLHPTVLPAINFIDSGAKQYVDDYYTLISYLDIYSNSLNTQNSLTLSFLSSIFDFQSEANSSDILRALISETNSQYQLLSQSSLVLDNINNYSSGRLDNLKSTIKVTVNSLEKQFDIQEIILQLMSEDSDFALVIHDNNRQNPYSGNIIGVITSQVQAGKFGKLDFYTSSEIDQKSTGRLESTNLYRQITDQSYLPFSDFLYLPGSEGTQRLFSHINSGLDGSEIKHLAVVPITLFENLDYQGLQQAVEAYRQGNSYPLQNYFTNFSQKLIESPDTQATIIKNLSDLISKNQLVFNSTNTEINRLASVSGLHLEELFLPCHPSLPTDCQNSHLGIYHTLFGQDQSPNSVSYNQNLKITTDLNFHNYNLSLGMDRLESTESGRLVDLVTINLPLDHVLESLTYNSKAYDLSDIDYQITGNLKQFQVLINLENKNNTLNLTYKQPQPLKSFAYSFHLSSNMQKTRSDQILKVLYEYPSSLSISGYTRQVEIIPGGVVFEVGNDKPSFGVVFSKP